MIYVLDLLRVLSVQPIAGDQHDSGTVVIDLSVIPWQIAQSPVILGISPSLVTNFSYNFIVFSADLSMGMLVTELLSCFTVDPEWQTLELGV